MLENIEIDNRSVRSIIIQIIITDHNVDIENFTDIILHECHVKLHVFHEAKLLIVKKIFLSFFIITRVHT